MNATSGDPKTGPNPSPSEDPPRRSDKAGQAGFPIAAVAAVTYSLGSLRSTMMEQTIFIICMFFGVASVAMIAFTLLAIALGKVKV